MKNFINDYVRPIVAGILIGMVLIGIFYGGLYIMLDQHYTNTRSERCQVIAVDDNLVTAVDTSGNAWKFTANKTMFEGEIVVIHFLTQGTEDIQDDVVEFVESK